MLDGAAKFSYIFYTHTHTYIALTSAQAIKGLKLWLYQFQAEHQLQQWDYGYNNSILNWFHHFVDEWGSCILISILF
jgi:hypothetical protein